MWSLRNLESRWCRCPEPAGPQVRAGGVALRLALLAMLGAAPSARAHQTVDSTAPASEAAAAAVEHPSPAAVTAPGATGANPLPFAAAPHAGDRFAVSTLTKTYDAPLIVFASSAAPHGARTVQWLESRGAAASAASADDSSNVRLATGGRGEAAGIPAEEKKKLEPAKPPISVGIPSPVAIAGSLAGGLVLLVKLITALSR